MATESVEMVGDRNGDAEVRLQDRWGSQRGSLNMNSYANKKSAAESMLDLALLMANASQLKAVVEQGSDFTFYKPLVALLSLSIIFQIVVGVLLIFIVNWNLNDESTHNKGNTLENIVTVLVLLIVIANIIITVFGAQRPLNQSA
ncbi:ninjurin-1-like [Lampris incognitus]|uniref:ninjurin-1-like n=1 Tax=Lampris incognitus TaxID=2546036 RepID=UPI0024B4F794|nr:ninjurin-1-like [Lampris incognitus]